MFLFIAAMYFERAWYAHHHGGVAPDEAGAGWVFTWQAFALALLFAVIGTYAIIAGIVRALKR